MSAASSISVFEQTTGPNHWYLLSSGGRGIERVGVAGASPVGVAGCRVASVYTRRPWTASIDLNAVARSRVPATGRRVDSPAYIIRKN
jgi:hypothetical protein